MIGRLIPRFLAVLTVGVYILFVIIAAINTHNRIGLGGSPLFYDFSVFYQAASFADTGRAADAYDDNKMIAAEQEAFPGSTVRLPWNYPPTFQLILMPFGAMPYVAAWLVWSCALYGFYALMARRLVDSPDHLWILLLAPGVAVNLFFGQNGLLSFLLMGAGVLMLERRPVLGGILLGMLAYKPQFAVLAPLVLLIDRQWRALAAAIVSEAVLASVSAIVFGVGPWLAFLHKIAQPASVFTSSSSNWRAIPSVMIFARSLGLNAEVSSVCHWIIAAMAAAGALWGWHKTRDVGLRAAVLATATLLITPYLRGYDLVLLVFPIATLLPRAKRKPIEKVVIFAAWILPAILMFMPPSIQFGPVVSVVLMIVILFGIADIAPAGYDRSISGSGANP